MKNTLQLWDRTEMMFWSRGGGGLKLQDHIYGVCNKLTYLIKWRIHFSCEIDRKWFFDQKSALQTACDTSMARVTGCVYPREGYRSVTPLLMPGSRGLTHSALFCARKLYNPHWGGQNQTSVEFSMYETVSVTVWVSFWSGLLGSTVFFGSTGFVRKFLCTPCICMWQTSGGPAQAWCSGFRAVESWWNVRWTSIATAPK